MASTSTPKVRNQPSDSKGSVAKKRRHYPSGSEDNEGKGASLSKKYCGDLPLSKIYNSSFKSNKPAELFRKDLISAMKLPDTEQLNPEDYWIIADSWKQEWEKGVQVPVNPDALAEPCVRILNEKKKSDFRLPKKFIKCTQDKNFSPDIHVLSNAAMLVDKVCSYDLDVVDIEWLKIMNEELKIIGLSPLEELTMELIMEEIETQCYDNLQEVIKTEEGLGIEYDDDVICDVCRSPDSEEGNEMVFCDACNICVHQACYGITKIPEGSWVCRTCALGIRPSCILCPNRGGAMKSTRSGQKWTHVSCALWIPEVAIENVDKMEPITKIAEIPASRWALVCSLCREKTGACIQCSVKTCKTAYHVTCAFEHGLAMKAIIDGEEEEDDVDLKSYCLKHTKEKKGILSDTDPKNTTGERKGNKKELEMSSEEKANVRLAKMQKMEAEFYKYVSISDVAHALKLNTTIIDFVYQYWKLKRRANFNKPLIMPKSQSSDPVEVKECDSIYARMKMFVHLRQDLERVRNLCYMVNKREKLSRTWYKIKQEIFKKQAAIVSSKSFQLKENEMKAVLDANHGNSVYDIMTSCPNSPTPSVNSILSALDGTVFIKKESHNNFKHNRSSLQRLPNPYAKHYLNGVLKRSQRSVIETCTEQENKNKSSNNNNSSSSSSNNNSNNHNNNNNNNSNNSNNNSNNNNSSNNISEICHQDNKDIDEKFASLHEAYKLKPMEVVVDKLPEIYERIEHNSYRINSKHNEFYKQINSKIINRSTKLSSTDDESNEDSSIINKQINFICDIDENKSEKLKVSSENNIIRLRSENNEEKGRKNKNVQNKEIPKDTQENCVNNHAKQQRQLLVSNKLKLESTKNIEKLKETLIDSKQKNINRKLNRIDTKRNLNEPDQTLRVLKTEKSHINENMPVIDEKINSIEHTNTSKSSNKTIMVHKQFKGFNRYRSHKLPNSHLKRNCRSVNSLHSNDDNVCDFNIEKQEQGNFLSIESNLELDKEESSDHLSVNNIDLNDQKQTVDDSQSNSCGENKIQTLQNTVLNENESLECIPVVNTNREQSTLNSVCIDVDNNSSSSSTNYDINNKRQSLKPNMYNKLSPTADKSTSSTSTSGRHLNFTKDTATGIDKDKLREESAKIRESLFSNNNCSVKSLSGYKIPKKLKTDMELTDRSLLQNKRGSSIVSPLSEVCQQTQVGTYSLNGYHTDRNQRWQGTRNANNKNHSREQKLVLKLRKEPGYSNIGRWHSNTNAGNRTDFNSDTSPNIIDSSHCDKDIIPTESHSRSEREFDNRTSHNNNNNNNNNNNTNIKYLPRLKKFSQKGQNGDYWVSYA